MAEYIEREKVIERIDLSIKSWSADYNSNAPNMVRAYKDVKSRLESIPAADVVEVVRCKDCKYHNKPPCPMRLSLNWTKDNDFCSYGERKKQ